MATTYVTGQNILYDTIMSYSPALYWPLGTNEQYQTGKSGHTDHTANARNANPPSATNLVAKLSDEPIDGSYDFLGGGAETLTSTYTPFTASSVLSIHGLFNPDATVGTYCLIGSSAASNYVEFSINGSSMIFNDDGATSVYNLYSSGSVINNTYSFVLIIDEAANTTELFLSGRSYGPIVGPLTYNSPGNFKVGAKGSGSSNFDGRISHIALWTRRLTQLEIRSLYHSAFRRVWGGSRVKNAIVSLTPSCYLPLNAEYGMRDMSNNGRDATQIEPGGQITVGTDPSLTKDPNDSSSFFTPVGIPVTANPVNVPSYNPFVAGSQRTFAGIFRIPTLVGTETLFGGGDTTTTPCLVVNSGGSLVFTPGTGTATWGPLISNNVIYTFILTFDDSTNNAELFINNSSQGVLSTATAYTAAAHLTVGWTRFSSVTDILNGTISHFCVFDRILSAGDRTILHEALAKQPKGYIVEGA